MVRAASSSAGAPRRTVRWLKDTDGNAEEALTYGRDGDDYLVVASEGGADEHPLWYRSLRENPDVHVRELTERFAARAETLSPDEKARVWPHLVEVYGRYEEYQQKTTRDIRWSGCAASDGGRSGVLPLRHRPRARHRPGACDDSGWPPGGSRRPGGGYWSCVHGMEES